VDNSQRTETSPPEGWVELVEASQAGERGAFDELVRLYQRRAMQAAVRVLGDANDAAEAVQTGFVRAYLNIGKLREPKRFEAWLLRIVTNAAISQARAAKRRTEKIRIAEHCDDRERSSPVERETAKELKEAIQRAMLQLSKKEAKAMSLFGLNDLSYSQVAEIMDCSVGAVRWHVFRARQKLRVLLKEYLE
jgi:RNA polymerase sigma-70 factor (ECF subfamily)